ncbi:hypothetical protein WDZ17_12130 [Pseudokineococcus basanitobsidens]|uniref:Dolichyl-phosphate-mannose-protein mannosyltransferase n=1 Tax=Pseudokineococcus basanitobsidens TaxID=1926649 RepID=A0ABU8RLV2_9ACTN
MSALAPPRPAAPPPPASPARPPARGRSPRGELLLVLAALLAVGIVHAVGLAGWPAFFDDEGTYLSQAWAVPEGALAPYTYWYDHPPAGWLQLAALSWLPSFLLPDGAPALVAGRVVMVGYTLATATLLYLLARRLRLGPALAAAGMLLWGLNPLVVFEGRQVLLDNIALPWLVGALVLVSGRRRDLWHVTAAGFCFGTAVLTKETLLVLAPAVLVALWVSAYRPTRAFAVMGFSVATALTGATYLLMALLRDELLPGPGHVSLWDALAFQMGRPGSGFILAEGSGAHGTLGIWLHYDAVLVVAGLAAAVVCCAVRRLRAVGVGVALVTALALRPDGYLPFMYVVVALPLLALAVVGVLDVAWKALGRLPGGAVRRTGLVVAVTAAVAAVGLVAPRWLAATAEARGSDANAAHREALAYVEDVLPRDSRVVVDNTYWNDLVRAGWSDDGFSGAIWFYKIDLDAEARTELPGGWRDLDYLVWSPTLADDPNSLPTLAAAHENSELLAAFGGDDPGQRVEVRRVVGPGVGPGGRPASGEDAAPDVPTGDTSSTGTSSAGSRSSGTSTWSPPLPPGWSAEPSSDRAERAAAVMPLTPRVRDALRDDDRGWVPPLPPSWSSPSTDSSEEP